jgi:putative FmdB family regulatory protein
MPTYDYECDKCGHKFEYFQGIKDANLKQCPKCKRTGLRRLIGAGSALIFKGSGFYITDYTHKSTSYTEAQKKDQPPAPTPPASGTNCGPAKTEPKNQAKTSTPSKKKKA